MRLPHLCAAFSLLFNPALAQDTGLSGQTLPEPGFFEQGISFKLGVAAMGRFNVNDGFDNDQNEFEVYTLLSYGGFYGGAEITTRDYRPQSDFEYDVFVGYGTSITDKLWWDISYRYTGIESTPDSREEFATGLYFPLTDRVDGFVALFLDPRSGSSDQEIGFDAELTERWALHGFIGNSDRYDETYGELTASYSVTDALDFEVSYEDTSTGDGYLGFGLRYEIGNRGQ